DAAVKFLPGDAAAVVLAGDEAALQVAREPVGAVGRLLEHAGALPWRVFDAAVVVDVAEQEVAALLPPQRPLGRPEVAAKSGGEFLDRLRLVDDLFERGIELLDALGRLRPRAEAAAQGEPAGRARQFQHVPAC